MSCNLGDTDTYNQCIYRNPEAFLSDIKQAEDLIFKAIGTRPRIVRAPGGTQGHFHVNYYNALDAEDYLIYDWNVSAGDAAAPRVPADQLVHNIKSQVPGKSRIIILMHDAAAKVTTVEALPRIIKYLKQQGYAFGVITRRSLQSFFQVDLMVEVIKGFASWKQRRLLRFPKLNRS